METDIIVNYTAVSPVSKSGSVITIPSGATMKYIVECTKRSFSSYILSQLNNPVKLNLLSCLKYSKKTTLLE